MASTAIYWTIGLYLFAMLVTFGHIFRAYGKLSPRHYFYILGAPAWWIVTKGVRGTLNAIGETIYENHILWAIGFVAAGHYLATANQCSTAISCSATLAKATFICLPPVAFVYWGTLIGAG